ncbi:uncharacterized protein HMPREF1541_01866 [Cyphellophora europaea CBS 101466]|uniref:Uncharacterized protein n=1 Tax=Cyphellophora europaea (strain CBS 101466) TaxID=1220924 RepID=W2S3T5_CYPE1|nr:uncharacterized protein HMPREF1541_01866 [Cyphellophora europaea CBS 101466]ETN42708.1 hypothetical protein HMPREF1541_01866 [Cyphellophora europaea CBS 101466]
MRTVLGNCFITSGVGQAHWLVWWAQWHMCMRGEHFQRLRQLRSVYFSPQLLRTC